MCSTALDVVFMIKLSRTEKKRGEKKKSGRAGREKRRKERGTMDTGTEKLNEDAK